MSNRIKFQGSDLVDSYFVDSLGIHIIQASTKRTGEIEGWIFLLIKQRLQ